MKPHKLTFVVLILLTCNSLFGQHTLDFLKNKSYDELYDLYKKENNHEKKEAITIYYINKATKENNDNKKASGYWYMAYLNSNNEKGLIAADSLIKLALKGTNDFKITSAIKLKARFYYENGNFNKALDYYLKAREYAQNKFLHYEINYKLGLIKTRLGKHREALNIFKEILSFNENIYKIRKGKKSRPPLAWVLNAKYAVANSYKDLGLLDSASYINKIGLIEISDNQNHL